tara:strand:+ start:19631 stop:24496 length:4866 start_codon:yes stop_codon:yes gene_type:complete
MAWDATKEALLGALSDKIDRDADEADRASLHNLAAAMYGRFPAEDMRLRSVEDLYGCLCGMLRFMRSHDAEGPKVSIFNPDVENDGWESHHTSIAVLCQSIPFCTASVRGELNRRNLMIHTIISANLGVERAADGQLLAVLPGQADAAPAQAGEALLFFEIERHARLQDLEELRTTLIDILGEVAVVVADFPLMCQRLQDAADAIKGSECIEHSLREEAVAYLVWMEHDHMTLLGYEYLEVDPPGSAQGITLREGASLGLLRKRNTRGMDDLAADLTNLSHAELLQKQLSFSKSRRRSRVHRSSYPDYVEVREYDSEGRVVGQHRFIGLYTSLVYNTDPRNIPILRRKFERVLEMSLQHWSDHEARELVRTLQVFPRDELFQSSIEELCSTVNAVNRIQERRQIRVFVRRDVHGKFVNCLVYLPRDHYRTELREKIEAILGETFHAEELEFNTFYSESVLVRVYFVMQVNPAVALDYDIAELQSQIEQATLSWEDRLRLRLLEELGDETGEAIFRRLGRGFAPGYQDDFDPRIAVMDIRKLRRVLDGEPLAMSLYRLAEEGEDTLRLRLYHPGSSLPLSDVLPILENLGLRVLTERPYEVRTSDGMRYWVQEFGIVYGLAHNIVVREVKAEFEDAFGRIWFGGAENDYFNRLLIGSRLNWREIALLRAYARYLRQLQFPFSVEYMAETMANHLPISAGIVELFLTRLSPAFEGDENWRAEREAAVEQRVLDALEQVENLGEDRIIRQYLSVVKATQRTNFFQQEADGSLKSYFSFKLSPAEIPGVPRPVPMFEIYVYSPRVEGVHLRGGRVARGGLRWSDRQEDFRTEVLGLVKAQQVKNAVIVPVGAKGGFVARQLTPHMQRAEVQQEGEACYQLFIRGLLDITDNRVDSQVVHPPLVVARDDEDPYLVVAADKGTATFSDMANRIAGEYGFWLGDAFASGGSAGYDHKKMGITARGAWVSVQRHFREMEVDIQRTEFSVVGIGDMAGDVFGNGMLLSEQICLLAAFNHRHIFIDPNPHAATSFAERARLFNMPRSAWSDYDQSLISAGGGVFERSAKSITLSPQIRQRFDIEQLHVTPAELITCLLKARVDLLWNGGIGTYVKASVEDHTDVGDKANDALRVDASELRCKVIGEGGNLGMTQLARVEFSLAGGCCNTDFIDNAGGVDCSDHEVNIKILLNAVVACGDLTMKHRDALLQEMTDSVAQLVLQNNYRQTQAISLLELQAESRSGEYQRFMHYFEEQGRLDRALEFLPTDEELTERRARGEALTRPELSILLSYNKAVLKEQLMHAELGDDPFLGQFVATAFPALLAERYPDELGEHRLRSEIMATQIANDIVNRMGLNFVARQRRATGASTVDVARAYTAVMEIYGLADIWLQVEALDHSVAASVQMDMMLTLISLVKRATRWLLRNRRSELSPSLLIEQFRDGLAELRSAFPDILRERAAQDFQQQLEDYCEQGVPQLLAARVAGCNHAYSALGIIQGAREAGEPRLQVARLYYLLGEQLELDWLSGQILNANVENEWQSLARDTYLEDLEWQQRTLAIGALAYMPEDDNLLHCMARWQEKEASLLDRWHQMLVELRATQTPDFAMLAVANRELLDLAQSTSRSRANSDAG